MNNKLQGKDLINIGIFTAIYFIVIFAAASIGFIPIFIPLISVIVPLVGGIPMMLFFSKIKKFGMLTICGVLLGIIMLLTGMGYWCIQSSDCPVKTQQIFWKLWNTSTIWIFRESNCSYFMCFAALIWQQITRKDCFRLTNGMNTSLSL